MTTNAIKFLYQGYDFYQERQWRAERERRECLINEVRKVRMIYHSYVKVDSVPGVWPGIPEAR